MGNVFVVRHVHEINVGEEEVKFIGVYRSEEDALAAIERLKTQPGFVDTPEGFECDKYELNKDHWAEGFKEVDKLS